MKLTIYDQCLLCSGTIYTEKVKYGLSYQLLHNKLPQMASSNLNNSDTHTHTHTSMHAHTNTCMHAHTSTAFDRSGVRRCYYLMPWLPPTHQVSPSFQSQWLLIFLSSHVFKVKTKQRPKKGMGKSFLQKSNYKARQKDKNKHFVTLEID